MTQESLGWKEFQEKFSTEKVCSDHLFGIRWPGGYRCPRCGHDRYYFHGSRHLYQCKSCRYQVSLTAGSIFHRTRIPLQKWFQMIFLMATSNDGISLRSLQRILDIKDYKNVWIMGNKIRKGMANLDAHDKLAGFMEEDHLFDRILSSCLNTPVTTFSDLKARRIQK